MLDWQGLAVQLDAVIRYHPDADTRVSAQRIKDGIVNVAAAADNLQRAKGITPVKRIADLPTTSPTSGQTSSQSIAQKNPPAPGVIGDPLAPPKLAVPGESPTPVSITPLPITGAPGAAEPVAPTEIATKQQAPAAPAKAFVVEGFVTQQNFENVGVSEVLVDGDSNIVAFLKVQVGKDIQLSEYYWRWVGVKGEVQHVDQSKHTLGRDVPLVIVDGLSLSGR